MTETANTNSLPTEAVKIPTLLQRIDKLDKNISAFIHGLDYGFFNYLILVFACTFNTPFVIVIPSAYIYWRAAYRTREILHYIILQLIGVAITLALKRFFGRPRPILDAIIGSKKTRALRKRESNHSMPSGDSMQVALFAAFCYLNFNEAFWFWIIPVVMYGRVHFMCHYLADTVVGASVGLIVAFVFNKGILSLLKIFLK